MVVAIAVVVALPESIVSFSCFDGLQFFVVVFGSDVRKVRLNESYGLRVGEEVDGRTVNIVRHNYMYEYEDQPRVLKQKYINEIHNNPTHERTHFVNTGVLCQRILAMNTSFLRSKLF